MSNATLHNANWSDVLNNIDPFALASVGSSMALVLCVIGAAWLVVSQTTGWANADMLAMGTLQLDGTPQASVEYSRCMAGRRWLGHRHRYCLQGNFHHGRQHRGRRHQGATDTQQEPDLRHLLRGHRHLRRDSVHHP